MPIRDATIDDLPRIVEIYNESIPSRMATADPKPVSVEAREDWFHSHNPNTRPIWVLEDENDRVVAWISVRNYNSKPGYDNTVEASLYVAGEAQGQGHGTRLLKEMIEHCRDVGIKAIINVVFAHNEISIRMGIKLGFQLWGRLPGVVEMDDESYDVEIWGLRLRA